MIPWRLLNFVEAVEFIVNDFEGMIVKRSKTMVRGSFDIMNNVKN